MRKLLCSVGACLLYALLASTLITGTLGDPKEVCQSRNISYNIADSKQCDLYHECTKGGKLLERLCDDGFQFSEEIHACDYPHNVNCTGREKLQESPSKNPQCPRMNGFYPFPPEDSCQKFYHCLEGVAYEKTCPDGVIFDLSIGACIHPDRSHRTQCAAKSVLNFTCPNHGKKFVRLRFGDHDRLPHPTNCRKFFICLADGKPRVGGCPLGKVFNPKIGVCDSPKRVPQCKDYYGKKDLAKLAKLAELGEEGSLAAEDEGAEIESTVDDDHHDDSREQAEEDDQPKSKQVGKKFHSRRNLGSVPAPPASVGKVIGPVNNAASQKDNSKNSQAEADEDSDDED